MDCLFCVNPWPLAQMVLGEYGVDSRRHSPDSDSDMPEFRGPGTRKGCRRRKMRRGQACKPLLSRGEVPAPERLFCFLPGEHAGHRGGEGRVVCCKNPRQTKLAKEMIPRTNGLLRTERGTKFHFRALKEEKHYFQDNEAVYTARPHISRGSRICRVVSFA